MSRASDRASKTFIPAAVLLTVTHRCQLACEHCYQARHESEDLSADELFALMDELVQLGTLHLTFTGGEALLRKDIFALLEGARKRAFAITLFSNGGPITPAVAARLKELRVMAVEISIHGSHAATHDGFVGRKGAFERAVRAVELLDDVGIPVLVKSNVVRCNVDEMAELSQLFSSRPRVKFGSDALLHVRDDGKVLDDQRVSLEQLHKHFGEVAQAGDAEEVAELGRMLAARPSDAQIAASHPCGAGRTSAAVQPNGDVLACVQIPTLPLGNLRQKRFSELWLDSPPVRALRALTLQKFAECSGCEYQHVCAKCPALSLNETGKLEGHSLQVCQQTKAFWGAIKKRLAIPEGQAPVGPFPRPHLDDVAPSVISCGLDAPRRLPLRVVGG